MREVATGVARHPDRRPLPWPIQCPELGAVAGASGHRPGRNPKRRHNYLVGVSILASGAFAVCRGCAAVHPASVFRPSHHENATSTANPSAVQGALRTGNAPGSRTPGSASSIISRKASFDCLKPTSVRIHSVHRTALDRSSARSALVVRSTNSAGRGLLLAASIDKCRGEPTAVRAGPSSAPSRDTYQRRRWSTTLALVSE